LGYEFLKFPQSFNQLDKSGREICLTKEKYDPKVKYVRGR
jgi:hypothetical protein